MDLEHKMNNSQRLETKAIFTEFLDLSNTFLQKSVWELSKIVKELFYENVFLEYESLNPEEYLLGIDLEERRFDSYKTLKEYLNENVNLLNLKESKVEGALNLLIELLDEHGFLRESPEKIAKSYELDLKTVNKAIELLKKIGPKGIATKGFPEYYSLFLTKSEAETLKRLLNGEVVPHDQLEMIREKLNNVPFCPASGFSNEEYKGYIIPDIIIKKQRNGVLVLLNEIFKLKLTTVELYKKLISKNENIRKEYEKALEIVKAMNRRNKIMLAIANFIADYQKETILYGEEPQPLSLKMVAENLNLSISTISRAVKDKYVLTDRGVFELKRFFVRNVSKGVKISPEKLKDLILEVTDNGKIDISDSKIASLLERRGIKISRRTINKYRNILGIFKGKRRS